MSSPINPYFSPYSSESFPPTEELGNGGYPVDQVSEKEMFEKECNQKFPNDFNYKGSMLDPEYRELLMRNMGSSSGRND